MRPSRSPGPAYSGSSTSITSGFCCDLSSAAAIVPENSRSVMIAFASPWSSMNAIASASSLVFSVFSTAPAIGTPKWHSYISGMFGSIAATVSPRPMPRFASAEASRRQRT